MPSQKNRYYSASSGFTLVEMSVVVVIISFILMAVLKGQDMMHKARLDSAIADLQKYKVAALQFRAKYHYLPGDIPNPTYYMSGTTCATSGTNTCAGNGDGQLLQAAAASGAQEGLRAWQHMALTEIIPGTYTGVRSGTTSGVTIGRADGTDNIPSSRLEYELGGQGGYWFYFATALPVSGAAANGNYLLLGRDLNASTNDSLLGGIISPKNAATLDRKIDDGLAQSGLFLVDTSSAAPTICVSGGSYVAGDDTQGCVVWFNID